MPKGEWVNKNDMELDSQVEGEDSYTFDKGTPFALLDTNGESVVLGAKGSERLVIIGIKDFHDIFEPHWRKSENMTF